MQGWRPAITLTQRLVLPSDKFRLEEINMPEKMAASLAGQTVVVEVLPEEQRATICLDHDRPPDGLPILIDECGIAWNAHWPARVLYTDASGRAWRLPRHWLTGGVSPVVEASRYEARNEERWVESWYPPTWWDMSDINIPDEAALESGDIAEIEVSLAPGEVASAFWKDTSGKKWRIPHDWRRRRIKLPDGEGLRRNLFPRYLIKEFGGRIVAVNYHPGSLCCLHDGYRVRDEGGGKWPVRAADCVVVGFGDEAERRA
jgi:hypothetical protein